MDSGNIKKDFCRVLIVGGGFAGIETALSLSKDKNFYGEITLMSDKDNFEYYPALYRMILGKPRMQITIPLKEIFENHNVSIVCDKLHSIDEKEMLVRGATGHYHYDFLVLALGSETIFFGVEGLSSHVFPFKSVHDASSVHDRLHEFFRTCKKLDHKHIFLPDARIVVIGGGPTGVEVSVEIAVHRQELKKKYGINDVPQVTLIESGPRILKSMPEELSLKVQEKLVSLGVELLLSTSVEKQDEHRIYLKNSNTTIESKLAIWTAGVKPVFTYEKTRLFSLSKTGKVAVDEYLKARGKDNIFIGGDAADTPYSGSAQTALYGGKYIARTISDLSCGRKPSIYKPKTPVFVVPIGENWGVLVYKKFWFSGVIPRFLRGVADLRFFVSWLGLKNALKHFFARK